MPNQWETIAARALASHINVARAAFVELADNVRIDTPVDKGSLINNWFSAIGAPSQESERDPNPSGTESHSQLTLIAREVQAGLEVYFTNPLPYANRIEYEGYSQKAPSGMLRKNVAKWSQIVERKERELSR